MTLLVLQLHDQDETHFGWRGDVGIELSLWCQDQGLVRGQDYDWQYVPNKKQLHFKFYGSDPSFASFFSLHWGQYL